MTQHTTTKIEIVDVETGDVVTSHLKRRKATRSKGDDKKTKLLYSLLYGRETTSYFTSQFNLSEPILDLMLEFSLGTIADVQYLAETLIKARRDGTDKNIVLAGAIILSLPQYPEAKEVFRKTFKQIVLDLYDVDIILTIAKAKTFRGFGKSLQKAINALIRSLNPYDILDYVDMTDSSGSSTFKFRDILRICHTKPANEVQKSIFAFLTRKIITTKLPKIFLAHKDLLKIGTATGAGQEIIKNNNFPMEIIRRRYPSSIRSWDSILDMTTLKDIVFFLTNSGSSASEALLDRALLMLKSDEVVKKSSLTPFHFLKLYDEFRHTDLIKERRIKRAIEKALEISFENVPEIKGSLVIILDQSQDWGATHYFSPTITDSASMAGYAAIFSKMCKDSYIISITRKPSVLKFTKQDSIIDIIDMIIAQDKGGTADIMGGFKLLSTLGKADNILAISSASWYAKLRQTSIGNVLSDYLTTLGPEYTTRLAFWSATNQDVTTQNLRNTTFASGNDYYVINYLMNFITKKI